MFNSPGCAVAEPRHNHQRHETVVGRIHVLVLPSVSVPLADTPRVAPGTACERSLGSRRRAFAMPSG